jgi:carboxypeptidase PM20D1
MRWILSLLAGLTLLLAVLALRTVMSTHSGHNVSVGSGIRPNPINKAAAVEHLAGAIRYETVSVDLHKPSVAEVFHSLHSYLEQSYPLIHRTIKREYVNRYSLLYTWRGSEPSLPGVLLLAHMDVVPVDGNSEPGWTHPPFSGDVADGFVWGRGALDMKGSLIGLLEAVEYLLGKGFNPRRTIYLAFGHDEETGGQKGAPLRLYFNRVTFGSSILWMRARSSLVAQ